MKSSLSKISFTEHLNSVDENYFQHMLVSFSFSLLMLKGFFACFIHALFPFCFEKTGSNIIKDMHENMVINRHKLSSKNQWLLTHKVSRSLTAANYRKRISSNLLLQELIHNECVYITFSWVVKNFWNCTNNIKAEALPQTYSAFICG